MSKKPHRIISQKEYREKVLKDFKEMWSYGHPMFYELIQQMCEIHELKNKSYGIGNSLGNFMECERFGIPAWKGCLVRLTDKVSRVYNLTSKMHNPEYSDAFEMENLEDTFLDLANYSLLCLVLLREAKKKVVLKKVFEKPSDEHEMTACEASSSPQ